MATSVTMTVRKVTISVDEGLLGEVDKLADSAGQSRSEWLASAAEQTIRQAKLRVILNASLERTGGPLTSKERKAVRAELGLLRDG
jgi:metal-responsive CopG/Arc/MetJ family transcriptional regulator